MKDISYPYRKQENSLILLPLGLINNILDKCFALCGILLSWPLMILSALAVRISSKGPVLFKQERLGLNEVPFVLMKFRTMIEDAEKSTGPKWASDNDPRITKVGKILRKTRLDELPQLFNVLKGEMSFVGPRPIRRHFADMLSKEISNYGLRFKVKPGITGWAQVNGGYAGTKEGQKEKFEYDLYYILNRSIWLDLLIILKTFKTVLLHKGQ
jgi:exopolysaccharide biosynthesis polyprenyl glycosylphosphotransferase